MSDVQNDLYVTQMFQSSSFSKHAMLRSILQESMVTASLSIEDRIIIDACHDPLVAQTVCGCHAGARQTHFTFET